MRSIAIVMGLAGLGALASSNPGVAAPKPVAKAPAACPDARSLRTLLARAWKIDNSRISHVGDAESAIPCAAGLFPEPGFVVAADIADKTWGYFQRLSVVGVDGTVIATLDGDVGKDLLLGVGAVDKLATADLDGDGADEILETTTSDYKSSPATTAVGVVALRHAGAHVTLKSELSRVYSYYAPFADDGTGGDQLCDGSFEVTANHELVVHGKAVGPKAARDAAKPDCVIGTETYVGGAGGLVKK